MSQGSLKPGWSREKAEEQLERLNKLEEVLEQVDQEEDH